MRFIALLLATTITLSASAASAALYYEVTTTVPSGNPLNALEVGDKLILDIGVYTDPGDLASGLSGSVNNYDESIVSANAAESTLATSFFDSVCIPTAGCFGGIANLESGLRIESGIEGPGAEATFVSGLTIAAAQGDGFSDLTPFSARLTRQSSGFI